MAVRGALAAGCDFFAGYPITPSSEIYSEMMRSLPERGGIAIGAPDEISSISYAVGASISGAHSMTATSGPGWSLMGETLGYAVMTETPVVVVVVQRLGPATGGATQGGQGDLFLVEYVTSGAYPIPVLAPVDAYDCYELTAKAFQIADRLRTPVVVLSDKEVGMTIESVHTQRLSDVTRATRTQSTGAPFVPYGIRKLSDVPAFAQAAEAKRSRLRDRPTTKWGNSEKNDPETIRQIRHLDAKISAASSSLEVVRFHPTPNARTLVISFGISARTCRELLKAGVSPKPVNLLEVLSLYPIPRASISKALAGIERVVVVEENLPGLYARELAPLLTKVEVRTVTGIGAMIRPAQIAAEVL